MICFIDPVLWVWLLLQCEWADFWFSVPSIGLGQVFELCLSSQCSMSCSFLVRLVFVWVRYTWSHSRSSASDQDDWFLSGSGSSVLCLVFGQISAAGPTLTMCFCVWHSWWGFASSIPGQVPCQVLIVWFQTWTLYQSNGPGLDPV